MKSKKKIEAYLRLEVDEDHVRGECKASEENLELMFAYIFSKQPNVRRIAMCTATMFHIAERIEAEKKIALENYQAKNN